MQNQDYISNDTHTLDRYNDMITKANRILFSKAKYEKLNKENDLKQKYLEAKMNYLTAPEQVEHTFKNYYIYEKGESAYNEEHEKILEQRVGAIIKTYLSSFQENMSNAKTLLKSYTSLLINYQNVIDYEKQLSKENDVLKKKLVETKSDILTNDRKTYYENQNIESLNFYYTILFIIYIALLIGFIVCMIFKSSEFSKAKQMMILVILILYPFLGVSFFSFVINILKQIGSMLPKNVYSTL
jgi:magnesium-transporting ATPase (P-type)